MKKRYKKKKSYLTRISNFFYPTMGYIRFFKYLLLKLIRSKGSPKQIAVGVAFGASISMTPLLGAHIIIALILTYFVRGNLFAAVLGTIVGNPWTFPFIWYFSYKLGALILFMPSMHNILHHGYNFSNIFNSFASIFLPMLVGGLIMGVVIFCIFYFIVLYLVEFYRKRHNLKKG